jgi:Tol biopolymer transport system component
LNHAQAEELTGSIVTLRRLVFGLTAAVLGFACAYAVTASARSALARNGVVAYSAVAPGAPDYDLWSVSPSGGTATNLTRSSTGDETGGVSYSPDGTRLAFIRDADLWTMGSDPAAAVRIAAGARDPEWSPDGSQIAFSGSGVETIAPDGTNRKVLLAGAAEPSWSPTGADVVVVSGDSLAIVHVATGAVTPFTPAAYSAPSSPEWSPDGTEIAFLAVPNDAQTVEAVFVMSVSGVALRELSGTRDAIGSIAWSPDATRIAFYAVSGLDTRTLVTVGAANGASRATLATLTTSGGDSSLAWQPLPGSTATTATGTTARATTTGRATTTSTRNTTTSPSVSTTAQGGKIITGTKRRDKISGTPSDDRLFGGGGNDRLNGLAGNDRLFGGPGNDVLVGGPGSDQLVGNAGNDRFATKDGQTDDVVCGPGRDTVIADELDFVTGCEVVRRSGD